MGTHQVGYASRIPSPRLTMDSELEALRQKDLKQMAAPGPSLGLHLDHPWAALVPPHHPHGPKGIGLYKH